MFLYYNFDDLGGQNESESWNGMIFFLSHPKQDEGKGEGGDREGSAKIAVANKQ